MGELICIVTYLVRASYPAPQVVIKEGNLTKSREGSRKGRWGGRTQTYTGFVMNINMGTCGRRVEGANAKRRQEKRKEKLHVGRPSDGGKSLEA